MGSGQLHQASALVLQIAREGTNCMHRTGGQAKDLLLRQSQLNSYCLAPFSGLCEADFHQGRWEVPYRAEGHLPVSILVHATSSYD